MGKYCALRDFHHGSGEETAVPFIDGSMGTSGCFHDVWLTVALAKSLLRSANVAALVHCRLVPLATSALGTEGGIRRRDNAEWSTRLGCSHRRNACHVGA